LFGDGDDVQTILKYGKMNPHISYCGVVPSTALKEIEKKAILLVNPRPSTDEYTKYSFPSKTLEYMSSGTATLSTKLKGIPDDYLEYLYWFDDEDEKGMTNKLKEIFNKSDQEIKNFGQKGSEFVYKEKSAISQTKKIIALFFQIYKQRG